MKAIDILAESKIDEAPVGALGQIGRKLGSAALGAAGLRTWAADLGGKAEMGDRANQYYTAFRKYLAQTGKDEKTADYADLAGFLKKSNLDTKYFAGKKGIIDPAVVNQGFTKMAQDYFKGTAATTTKSTRSSAGTVDTSAPTTTSSNVGQTTTSATGTTSTQPFSVPALLQVIPQMNKRDLNKILKVTQAALQGSPQAAKQAVSAAPQATQTTGMTAAQSKAVKRAVTTNKAQAAAPKAALLRPKQAVAV